MGIPQKLLDYSQEGHQIFKREGVDYLDFWGRSYFAHVNEEQKIFHPHLQLDEEDNLHSFYCSCKESESSGGCAHIYAAFLEIFRLQEGPLHRLFLHSFWNHLMKQYIAKDLQEIGRLKAFSNSMIQWQKEVIENRKDLDESFIDFLDPTQAEKELWREGKLSTRLSYEMSYWGDLAKLIFQKQAREEKYTFEFFGEEVPSQMDLRFEDLTLHLPIDKKQLEQILPHLNKVQSNLNVHPHPEGVLVRLKYDPKSRTIYQICKKALSEKKSKDTTIRIGEWEYTSGKGFYPCLAGLGDKKEIRTEKIASFLSEHATALNTKLQEIQVFKKHLDLKYTPSFDEEMNLHILAYIQKRGDLSGAVQFRDWIYLPNQGFYPLNKSKFQQLDLRIPENHVGLFVSEHHFWLNEYEGFQTHLAELDAEINYVLDQKTKSLKFFREITSLSKNIVYHDFQNWIYVKEQGFYPQPRVRLSQTFRIGSRIVQDEIPEFIRKGRQDLLQIPHFFAERSPLEEFCIECRHISGQELSLNPVYKFKEEGVLIFDNFFYSPNKGFYEFSDLLCLARKYRERKVILSELYLGSFFKNDFDLLQPYLKDPQGCLSYIQSYELRIDYLRRLKGKVVLQINLMGKRGDVPLSAIWARGQHAKQIVFSEVGIIDISHPLFRFLLSIEKTGVNCDENRITLSIWEFFKLDAMATLEVGYDSEEVEKTLEKLRLLKAITQPKLDALKSNLREYQLEGVQWLWFLKENGLSGLLCDDMGLGKTHQAMGLMASICSKWLAGKRLTVPKILIVCPTSVLYHWKEKLAEFLPEIPVYLFYGPQRFWAHYKKNQGIILTSYGILRSEKKKFCSLTFELSVLDEIQLAKNSSSQTYQSLAKIKSHMVVGLTGTPMENHLLELKTLFDLTLPGYFSTDAHYKEFFVLPIEKEQDGNKIKLLSKMIRPFVLRRKKQEVLKDLPEKIEEISHCQLLGEQEELYQKVWSQTRKELVEELNQKGESIPYIHIFAVLSKLKQICNHPAAYYKKPESFKQYKSGKWDLFCELLKEATHSGQKVVVFSQYLAMLDIIILHLKEENINYAHVRGSTRNRQVQIKKFQEEAQCTVFVASLQAVGLGVDLTAGSIVIHYDRWWNPAREDQATDRVYRFGQKRGVQVFKLMVLNTIEERINQLILHKKQLLEKVMSFEDKNVFQKLSRDDLLTLFSSGHKVC